MSADQLSNDLASLRIDRSPQARPPRRFPAWLTWLLVLGALGTIGYVVVYPRVRSALFTTEVTTGEVILVSPAQAQVQLTATGYVVAEVEAKVSARVGGRIAEIYVEEGQRIEMGAKVARLEDIDHRSALAAARARTAAARARVMTAKATLAETRQALARERGLLASGVSARSTVEDLEARLAALGAQVKASEAEASATAAEASAIEIQGDSYIVTSTVGGTVIEKLVEVGEVVAPGFGVPGVVEVVDLTSLVVEVDVSEARLAQVKVGTPAEIVLDAYPSQRFRGEVAEIRRRVNRAKATVPVKVRFVDRPAEVLPDMAARVSFLSAALDEAALKVPPKLVVPSAAVTSRGGAEVVFVLEEDKLRQTVVQLGGELAGGRELVTPLPAGTRVVLTPSAKLADGQKVKEQRP